MEKLPLSNKTKIEQKSDNVLFTEIPDAETIEEELKNQRLINQFAQDALIYERIKCRVMALACCLIYQV